MSPDQASGDAQRGDVESAARMLGRPHVVDGVVVRGHRRGVSLGFPTANLDVPKRLQVPATGVYAGCCGLPDGREVACVVNIGTNPTFGGQELRVEAHLLARRRAAPRAGLRPRRVRFRRATRGAALALKARAMLYAGRYQAAANAAKVVHGRR
jgi:FAD synthase